MAAFKFHTNPFSSPVGQRIERATDSSLPSEDWALFIEICDIINDTEEGAKDAVKAIKKRFSNKKDYKSIMYTLTLLESCVKNCGHRFHVLVASKDLLGELTKVLGLKGPNVQVPQVLQEKILSLIQSWSDAFRNSEDLQAYVHYHDQLKAQGYEFPAQDMESLAPIHTPKRSMPESEQKPLGHARTSAANGQQKPATVAAIQRGNSGPINPSPAALAKLRSELNIVEENCRILNEMLSTLNPNEGESGDIKLLKDLNSTCREMQQRIIELLGRIANDEVTGELLRINDILNNAFIRFDRFERNMKGASSPISTNDITPTNAENGMNVRKQSEEVQNGSASLLIDFGEDRSATASQPSQEEDSEFDMFAQTRGSTFADSRKSGSTYEDNTTNVPTASFSGAISSKSPYSPTPMNSEEDKELKDEIQDVEDWLKDTDLNKVETAQVAQTDVAEKTTTEQTSQAISNDEFDQFLTERSVVGPQRVVSQNRTTNGAPRQMQLIAGEKQEDHMFAL